MKEFMREALEEAKKAEALGEVPVGAVVVYKNEIIARAHNTVEKDKDVSAHAEILAIKKAAKVISDWRLNEASLFVTLEPCLMCLGAILHARVKELYFGAYDERQGAVGSLFDLSRDKQLPHQIEVYPEVMAEESKEILQRFFKNLRK